MREKHLAAFMFATLSLLHAGQAESYHPPAADINRPAPPPADILTLEPAMPCSAAVDQPSSGYHIALSPEQEQHALALWRKSIVITAHDHCFHAGDFEDMAQAGITVRTIKPTVDGIFWRGSRRYRIDSEIEGWEDRGKNALRLLDRQVGARDGRTIVVRTVDDIFRAKKEHKTGIIYSFEGARPLAGKLENVRMFHDMGLRELQLFWAVPSPMKNRDGTVSEFGLDVIREMNRLGVLIDLSHMGEAAFKQALDTTTRPVVISHCGVAAVSGKPGRGSDDLSDENLRRIAANHGAVCIHFYEGYIRPRHGPHATVEDLVDHIDYVRKLVGIDSVALGVDTFPESGWRWVEGAERMRDMPNVLREMLRRGFTDEEIEKVLGGNLIRVYRSVWK